MTPVPFYYYRYFSKKEKKYRAKLIAEYHLKKEKQMFMSDYLMKNGLTYRQLYEEKHLFRTMMMYYSIKILSEKCREITKTFNDFTTAIRNFKLKSNEK